MNSSQHELVDRLEKGIATMEAAYAGTPAQILDTPPAPGKWSIRQIVVHVADADIAAAMRYRQIAAGPGAKLTAWDQDVWANMLQYSKQSPEVALQAFSAIRRATVDMLRKLPEVSWAHVGIHEERGELSLETYLTYMADHAEKHATQIRGIRSKFGHAANV